MASIVRTPVVCHHSDESSDQVKLPTIGVKSSGMHILIPSALWADRHCPT